MDGSNRNDRSSEVQTPDLSRVLADALALSAQDPKLRAALRQTVEESIVASVRRDPRSLADALFPVMGPAIRKASVATVTTMMESLNTGLEHTISWRALMWRWEAYRSGKSFAEIVLLNTLIYRVEQVFLIHRKTGLLLQHASAGDAYQDPELVSAMLTAIRDFVGHSFRCREDEGLTTLRLGELTLLIEQGPHAILAAVVRGNLPPDKQVMFQHAVETIHLELGLELEAFDGDATPFERSRGILEMTLLSHAGSSPRSYRRLAVLATAILAILGGWLVSNVRTRLQWNDYLARLEAEPGIVVVSSGRRNGQFFVAGLRDPLARDPAMLLDRRLQSQSVARWEPYNSLAPPIVLARASQALHPPAGVSLHLQDDTLVARGPAPVQWIVESERLALVLPGIRRFVHEPLAGSDTLARPDR